jgi:hypothetical protein
VTGHPIADPDRDRIFERDAEDDYRAERDRHLSYHALLLDRRLEEDAKFREEYERQRRNDAYAPDSVPAAVARAVELLREWADDWMTDREAVAARRLAADVRDNHLRFL